MEDSLAGNWRITIQPAFRSASVRTKFRKEFEIVAFVEPRLGWILARLGRIKSGKKIYRGRRGGAHRCHVIEEVVSRGERARGRGWLRFSRNLKELSVPSLHTGCRINYLDELAVRSRLKKESVSFCGDLSRAINNT